VRDGLEQLLIAPAGLARLLVQVESRGVVGLDEHLDEPQKRCLLLVTRVELLRERDLVQAEPRVAGGALQQLLRVLVALELRHTEDDALLCLERQRSLPELRPEAGVSTKRGRRSTENSDEIRELPASGERTLQHRETALGRSQFVMDLEAALLGLHTSLSIGAYGT